MTNGFDHRRSAADRVLPLCARGDLEIIEAAFTDNASYVVKDPVAGEAFHLSAEEQALLEALRKPVSLRDLQRLVETRFAPRRATIVQLQQFVNRLYEQGLLISELPGQGAELLARDRESALRQRRGAWLQLLSIRLGGFDAGPLVDRLYRALGWAFSRWALLPLAGLIGFAALLAISHGRELATQLPGLAELVRPGLLPFWLAAVVGVKLLHELGHALACRHFGARPQEMGILLLAGAPSLYCDVTDAWRLPSKWRRMAVSGAGMFVELIVAAIAIIVWRYAEPGPLSAVCLSLVMICSIGTLLVNANPLFRYDGYYLLSDGLEVPNLGERARGVVGDACLGWLLGDPRQDDPLIDPRKLRALWVYALLAKVYLALVLTTLLVASLKLARPHQLENIVYVIAGVTLTGMLMGPITSGARVLTNPSTRWRIRWPRLATALVVLAVIVAGILILPITRRVEAPVVMVPAESHPLFALTPGELEYAAPVGATVAAGDVIIRLRNPELELALVEQSGIVSEQRTRLIQLRALQSEYPSAARTLLTATAELADAEAQLAAHKKMVESLIIRAPATGRILAPPPRLSEPMSTDSLRQWRGSPLDPTNVGAWIEAGTPLAVIGEPGAWVAWAGVEHSEIPAVALGQHVRLAVDQSPLEILTGRVIDVARRARPNASIGSPERRSEELPASNSSYHVVSIGIDDPAASLLAGARGSAKIAAYDSTVGELVVRELRRTFQRVF